MRELERKSLSPSPSTRVAAIGVAPSMCVAVIGAGRLGTAVVPALRAAGVAVTGPLRRGEQHQAADADAILLCVPDGEIASVAATIAPGPLVGHSSGATGLDALHPHEAFSLHPLMTVTREGAHFEGAGAAVAGTTPRAVATAEALAAALGMRPFAVEEEQRAAYHAAACIASNFLITLEAAAERLAARAGCDRELLVPLVRATVENWAELGSQRALTGPVARGDDATIARQRAAVAAETPDLLELFDALVSCTRSLAGAPVPA